MPTPEATDPKFWEDFWGWLLAAGGGLAVAVRQIAKRRKREDDVPAWVDRVVDALAEVRDTVTRVNEATTENIRAVLTLYGKDVTEIRSAQERQARELAGIREQISDLRVELARRNGNGGGK